MGDCLDQLRRWLTADGAPLEVPLTMPDGKMACAVSAWAASGAMALTGDADAAPVHTPATLHPLLTAIGQAIEELTTKLGRPARVDPAIVLGGRSALLGLSRRGQISAGGATRLLECRDGWCAVGLVRPDDRELVPAILGRPSIGDEWTELAEAATSTCAHDFADHIQKLGLPAAALPSSSTRPRRPWHATRIAGPSQGLRLAGARVVDLSSLWAGPLCARILGQAGAEIIKVESTGRPDGARSGNRTFYDWLHTGQRSVAVDFTTPAGHDTLASLIDTADIVIEASRPRALEQIGLTPAQLRHRPGRIWVAITGYGPAEPHRVAFGDDAAVAGGLVGWHDNHPVFCADAIADPLTGVCAALAVVASAAAGGGEHLSVPMRDVASAFATAPPLDHEPHELSYTEQGWTVHCARHDLHQPVLAPRAPQPVPAAPPLGADNVLLLS